MAWTPASSKPIVPEQLAHTRRANQTVRIDAALKHTDSSTKSTFRKFYDKPFVDIDSFQNCVLK